MSLVIYLINNLATYRKSLAAISSPTASTRKCKWHYQEPFWRSANCIGWFDCTSEIELQFVRLLFKERLARLKMNKSMHNKHISSLFVCSHNSIKTYISYKFLKLSQSFQTHSDSFVSSKMRKLIRNQLLYLKVRCQLMGNNRQK